MGRLALLSQILKEATDAIWLKRRQVVSRLHREAVRKLNQKQADATEKDLHTVLVPLIEKQVEQAVSKIASGSKKNLLDKKQATKDLKNAIAPVLILRMAEASRNQLLAVGLDLRKRRKMSGLKYNPNHDELGRFAEGSSGSSSEGKVRQIDTPEFKYWFGDSKVVDENGKPLVVYHGTNSREEINQFTAGKPRQGFSNVTGEGFYFTENTDRAWSYAEGPRPTPGSRMNDWSGEDQRIIPVYLSIKNPLSVDGEGKSWREVMPGIVDRAKELGHDGVIVKNVRDPGSGSVSNAGREVGLQDFEGPLSTDYTSTTYIAFKPTQIKSATGNSGKFDPNDSDITKSFSSTKTTTATEWLMQQDMDDLLDGMPSLFPSNMPFGILTELPKPYREKIVSSLRESFKQDYWDEIAATTEGDANRILERGLQEGRSIQDMAKDIREALGEEYYKNRATNIARTESGGALNAARRDAMDQLSQDLGEKVPMRPVWLSVLGNTTRDTHAALDGVPADRDGLWDLAGYMIPYPGHHSLPPEEKCNCRCSIFTEFGLQEEEANQLIQDYEERSNDGDE